MENNETHAQLELIPDPLAIGDVLCKMLALVSGSGIRTGTVSVTITACGRTLPGADPWSIHKLAGDETCRMDLGSGLVKYTL